MRWMVILPKQQVLALVKTKRTVEAATTKVNVSKRSPSMIDVVWSIVEN